MVQRKMEKLLTAKELADKLQVSVSAIYKWVDEHRIEYIDLGMEGKRRCVRFNPDTVDKLIEEKSIVCYNNKNGNQLVERKS